MDYDVVLNLPLSVFRQYNHYINSLRAEEDSRLLSLLLSSNDGNIAKQAFDRLTQENGEPITLEKPTNVKPEEGALDKLRGLQGGRTSNN